MTKRRSQQEKKPEDEPSEAVAENPKTPPKPRLRPGTKQALILELLQRDEGASLDELAAATRWLPHTTRAALTGLRKRGFAVEKVKAESGTRYHVGAA